MRAARPVDPSDSEKLGEYLYEESRTARAERGMVSGHEWGQLDNVDRAIWRDVARRVFQRFGPEVVP